MLKLKKEDSVVDASFGFKTVAKCEIIYPAESTYHQQRGIKYDTIMLGRPIYDYLCKRFGSYSFSWYFIYPDATVKYFDYKANEWRADNLLDLIKGGVE